MVFSPEALPGSEYLAAFIAWVAETRKINVPLRRHPQRAAYQRELAEVTGKATEIALIRYKL